MELARWVLEGGRGAVIIKVVHPLAGRYAWEEEPPMAADEPTDGLVHARRVMASAVDAPASKSAGFLAEVRPQQSRLT